MAFFETWLFSQFPSRYKKLDSYKDANNQGLLERFLKAHGMELDENFIPFIEQLGTILSVKDCDNKFLPLLGSTLGGLPVIDNLPATYRRILGSAIEIYKSKGTVYSFTLLFNILGYECEIVETVPLRKTTYDANFLYDDSNKYDQGCERCSDFRIYLRPVDNSLYGSFTITDEITAWALSIVELLKPIDCTYTGVFKADYKFSINGTDYLFINGTDKFIY